MLDILHLASFKCFEAIDLPLGPLTVLSGINGGGKSSVIQSLVLLSQTLAEREWSRSLVLNGSSLTLGGGIRCYKSSYRAQATRNWCDIGES